MAEIIFLQVSRAMLNIDLHFAGKGSKPLIRLQFIQHRKPDAEYHAQAGDTHAVFVSFVKVVLFFR